MRSFRITGSSEGLVVHVSLSRRPARQIERHLGTMPRLRRLPVASHLDELTSAQSGAVSRSQLLALGMSDDQIRRQLRRRWQQSGLPGVYLTFSGPIDFATRSWVAVLYAGAGATLALDAAAFLWGLRKDAPEAITVMVPADRRVVPQPFLDIRLRVHLAERRHPVRRPPVTTLEDTVLDLVEATRAAGKPWE
jgi:hypothetical protein